MLLQAYRVLYQRRLVEVAISEVLASRELHFPRDYREGEAVLLTFDPDTTI